MKNQVNIRDQITQPSWQNPVSQPLQIPEKPKVNYWMISTVILLIILAVGGIYTTNLDTKLSSDSQNTDKITKIMSLSPISSKEPTSTTVVTTNPSNNVVWKTQMIPIQEQSELLGNKTINLEIKVPSDWTIQTSSVAVDPATSTIKNCSISTITSKNQSLKITLAPICTGWSAQYSVWPSTGVIVLQQKRGGNNGLHNFYRVRVTNSINSYNYVDADTEPNRPLDNKTDQIMDALTIGYSPPNEGKDDFFFIAAHLTANFSNQKGITDNSLPIVDQIATSLVLR